MSANLERAVGRIEGKLDALLIEAQKTNVKVEKHDERLDSLERDRHTGKAFVAVVGSIAGVIAANLQSIFTWFKT